MHDRIIHLRRPPSLMLQEGIFVPERATGTVMDEVDRRWAALCEQNPAFFDGRVSHVLGVHRNGYGGASIYVADCAYRFYAVQDEAFDLGVRPLGVKGLATRDGRVLAGRRASEVAHYAGAWEFAPGGVVEPGERPGDVVQRELREETSLSLSAPPVARAIVADPVVRSWEVVFSLAVSEGAARPGVGEYTELRRCDPDALPRPHTEISRVLQQLFGSP